MALRRPGACGLALVLLAGLVSAAFAQETDTLPSRTDVAGAVTITNKGISIIPAFTLGKPAAIFDLFVRGRRLSFEPQFRYGFDGYPWSSILWWRYRFFDGPKFRIGIGAHPAMVFRRTRVSINGTSEDIIAARRYLAGEVSPVVTLTTHLTAGAYYLYSYGVEEDVTRNTHFLALRSNVTGVPLPGGLRLSVVPQVYYLRLDRRDGYYVNPSATVSNRWLPLSITAMTNSPIRTGIAEAKTLVWNVSLTYSID